MSTDEIVPDAAAEQPSGRVPTVSRRHTLFSSGLRRSLLPVLLTVIIGTIGWAFWYNQHRSASWRDIINPFYWIARSKGDDLYLPDTAFLKHGNRSLPEVALTFDDGPHAESRGKILDTLKKFGAHATFFDVGAHMLSQPALITRTLAEGSEIANHSNTHQRLDGLTPHQRHREINDTDITFFGLTHTHLTLLRPPGERYNDAVLAETKAKGYIVVGHSSAARDYETDVSSQFIIDRTCATAENGSIFLLHDYPATAAALPEILQRLSKQGFHFVTISEMIAHLPPSPRKAALAFQESQKESQKAGQ